MTEYDEFQDGRITFGESSSFFASTAAFDVGDISTRDILFDGEVVGTWYARWPTGEKERKEGVPMVPQMVTVTFHGHPPMLGLRDKDPEGAAYEKVRAHYRATRG